MRRSEEKPSEMTSAERVSASVKSGYATNFREECATGKPLKCENLVGDSRVCVGKGRESRLPLKY